MFSILILIAAFGVVGAAAKIYTDYKRNQKARDMVREMEEERYLKDELDGEDDVL